MDTRETSNREDLVKKTSISFLWHMHQPYYRDDLKGEIVMPWVFLHAIKDYYDMPWYLSQYPDIKATFNLVPSLLVQLKAYEEFEVKDRFLETLKEETYALTQTQKSYLIEYLFFSNVENMIKPLPHYYGLYQKRERYKNYEKAALHFDDAEFLDLEVLFLLSWCGEYLRAHNPFIASLLKQQKNFSQSQKITLLRTLSDFIKEIIPFYQELSQKGQIEITTTPFNHPIAPLLFDIQNAKKANPQTTLPAYEGDLKEDALLQIEHAISYYKELFGKNPRGFWPAEGSICYDFLEVLAKKGVVFTCSDEEVLYKSGTFSKEDIYKNNLLTFDEEKKIYLFFRDKTLSDLIGFTYSGWESGMAVEDFLNRIKEIHNKNPQNSNINIILDGENAWEHYPHNAKEFFDTLYTRLSQCSWCKTTLFSEVLKEPTIPQNTLSDIAPGSWINANFDIWIGHPEKNRAWELIFETKKTYLKERPSLTQEQIVHITNEFLIAESSDWFWWYGDDHHTDVASTFDLLFRTHLINIYILMGKKVPQSLYTPIIDENEAGESHFFQKATNPITPLLDGKISSIFEYMGSGEIDLEAELSSMNTSNFPIKKILLGCDKNRCYLALLGDITSLLQTETKIVLKIGVKEYLLPLSKTLQEKDGIFSICDDIVEISLPKTIVKKEEITLRLFVKEQLIQRIPLYSKITFSCDREIKYHWYI